MYEGFATKEMLQKRWSKDAEYEVSGSPWDQSPTLTSSGRSLDGYMQDPYTRCKGLNEIAPQVNHHASLFLAVGSPC
jgi:hypothetical protein